MNIVEIIGNLGKDPETKYAPNGQKVTTLSIADSSKKDTIWWRVTIWGDKFDKMLPFLKKGSLIMVVGEMAKPEIFTNKDSQQAIALNLTAEIIRFLPGKKHEEEGTKPVEKEAPKPQITPGNGMAYPDDELPF